MVKNCVVNLAICLCLPAQHSLDHKWHTYIPTGVLVEVSVDHHDGDALVIFAPPSCAPAHLDVLPAPNPPVNNGGNRVK